MMGIKLPPIREKQVEDASTQVPSSRPHIPLGTGRHLFPSLAIATCQWDDSADADVQEILELSFDELNSVLMQIEPGVSGQQIARALDSLSDHPNLKNVKTILTLSLNRVVAWSTGPTYPLIEAKLAEPRTVGSSSSFFGADPGDGIVVLATSPVPLLLVAAPSSKRFSFHINSLVSRTYRALTSALDSGRAAAVGLAGFRPCLVTELQKKLTSNGYAGIAAVQVDYSLVDRQSETTRFLEFCHAQSIVVLGSNPIPPKLKQAMATPLSGDAAMGARNHNADIYRILNQSSLLNIGGLKGVRRSSFDLNVATLDPYTPLVQAVQNIAKSRHLPWEAIAINYAMVKGTLPLLQPTSREEMDRCHQAVGWRLTFNELITLDRVSLPLTFKPKSRSQQQLLMPLKRLLARPSKPNLKAQAAAQPGNLKSPPPISPHRISIDLPLQNLLASPTGNRKMSLTIEGEGGTGEEVGRWRADITLSFIPSANPPLVSLEARPRSVAMGESDGTVDNMPERLPVGLLTPSNSSRPFSPPFFCDDELLFPAPPQRPWSPIAGHLRPASWSGQSPYTHHFLAKPDSFDTPSLPRGNPSHLAYSQSQLLFDLELESSSPWNLSPKLPSISTISSKDTQN